MKKCLFFISLVILFVSCEERTIYVPKQRGYFRIDLPDHSKQSFEKDFPYSFDYSTHAKINIDTEYNAEPYWINIEYPEFKATIHISYKNVENNLNVFVDDAHFLVFKHDIKADAIKTQEFHYDSTNVHGLLFDIKGDAASLMQFYLTDSSKHFLRGALYFNLPPNKDSLAPVIDYLRDDIVDLISTFKWKN